MSHPPLLNLAALRNSQMQREPYPWATVEEAFTSKGVAYALRQTFPSEGYVHLMRDTGNKRHDLHGRNLISQGELYTPKTGVFPDVWVRLANELLSDAYRDALTVASGIQLNDLQIDATLWHHPKGSFLDPHPDKPDKVLVHLFYFCEEDWSPDFGGCLRILRSSNIDDFAVEILPLINTSTYFIRSDQSWHGYKAMTAADRVRLSLQVVFYKGGMHYTKPLTE